MFLPNIVSTAPEILDSRSRVIHYIFIHIRFIDTNYAPFIPNPSKPVDETSNKDTPWIDQTLLCPQNPCQWIWAKIWRHPNSVGGLHPADLSGARNSTTAPSARGASLSRAIAWGTSNMSVDLVLDTSVHIARNAANRPRRFIRTSGWSIPEKMCTL